MITCIDDYICR